MGILKSSLRVESSSGEKDFLSGVLPHHLAIVMDGNGRWARRRGLPRLMGHHRGVESLKKVIESVLEFGIEYLTVFAFSTENWRRPKDEVSGLFSLLRRTLQSDLAEFHKNNIRLRVIGRREGVDPETLALMDHAVELTKDNTALNFTIAFNYGGRDDIVSATRILAERVVRGEIEPSDITEDLFSKSLLTFDLPDPDLFIRTSDVSRVSNFLIWQTAYTELVFLETYWPNFKKEDLVFAIRKFQKCQRKFGGVSPE